MKAAFGLRLAPVDFFAELFFTIFFAAILSRSPPLQGTLSALHQSRRGRNSSFSEGKTVFRRFFPSGRSIFTAFHLL
jgi:hypothetical protein